MKKVILMSAFAFVGVIALSSCKKDRTCQCEYDDSYVIKNQTKKRAKDLCEGSVNVGLINVSGSNGCYLL